MNEPFIKIDLHGLRQDEAIFHRGTNLRSMIQSEYRYHPKVQRIIPGDNPGVTVLILRELY